MAVETRSAVVDDCPELVSMMDDAAAELRSQRGGVALLGSLHGSQSSEEILRRALDDDLSMVWCALWEQVIVGYAIATVEKEDETVVHLRDIYSIPDAREIGVGEALLEAALAWAIAKNATAIDALALPGARDSKNLYERFGLTARLITVRKVLRP